MSPLRRRCLGGGAGIGGVFMKSSYYEQTGISSEQGQRNFEAVFGQGTYDGMLANKYGGELLTKFMTREDIFCVTEAETTSQLMQKLNYVNSKSNKSAAEVLSLTCAMHLHCL